MKILAIANSFGVDATRYLHGIARAAGDNIKVVTLYIGGCSLYRHYRNMLSEERAYNLYVNGMDTGFKVSMKEALLSDEWDIVTIQQSSPNSGKEETFHPFLEEISAYAKKCAPKAKQYMHMTWSYSSEFDIQKKAGYANREEMIPRVEKGYFLMADCIKADGIIPSLYAMNALYEELGEAVYRDKYHCSLGVARYMLGCVWYMTLMGKSIDGNTFRDFDVEVSEHEVDAAQRCAKFAVEKNKYGV